MENAKKNIYEMVTERIIAQMEKGVNPWRGNTERLVSHTTGRPYSFLNQLLLGFRAGEYLTFNQVKAEGGSVKAGEKSQFVVFWAFTEKTVKETDEKGNEITYKVRSEHPTLRYYNVFHIDQTTGIKPKYPETTQTETKTLDPIAEAEAIVDTYFDREDCTLNVCDANGACYSPALDRVTVPMLGQYDDAAEYYSTLFHEMTHSTGHPSRLNRDLAHRFGTKDYSREELVAEIGSAYLMQHAGIDSDNAFDNSVAYLQGWIKALKNDPKMIVIAAGKAETAAEFILTGKKPEYIKNN